MKVMALITWTDCENKYRSLQAIGHEVVTVQYDDRPHERHGELVDAAREIAPDMILFIGAVEEFHRRPVPRPDILRALNAVAPMVHMCNDSADDPWWPLLEEYDREKCFTIQLCIDGAHNSPISKFENGIVALTPVDFRPFRLVPWLERSINCGLVGGLGHGPRQHILSQLVNRGVATLTVGPADRCYDAMAAVMCQTKITFCHPMTGSGRHQHVKGRVIESGFSMSAVLELKGSPTSEWFMPGRDYYEYDDVDHAEWLLTRADIDWQLSARRLRKKVMDEHHPFVFWNKVMERAKELRK